MRQSLAERDIPPPPTAMHPVTADASAARRYWLVRVSFGVVWGIDAGFKWLPGFRHQYLAMVQDSAQGQPHWLGFWFRFWAHVIRTDPTLFAVLTALAETTICLTLILGIAQRASFVFGAVFAVLIWGIGEGFGDPYVNGSTDIGCAVMYTGLFVSLLLTVPREVRAAARSLDSSAVRRWPWFAPLTFHAR